MADKRVDLPQGTLDLLILKTLSLGAQHGWAISERLQQISTGVVQVQQGSLYPALHRLERKDLVSSEWKESENGRMAKVYSLTASGRKQLASELEEWKRYTDAIGWVLEA